MQNEIGLLLSQVTLVMKNEVLIVTNGTSQGLFVLLALIIFGVFVLIAFLLYRDKLQVGLSTIFDESTSKVWEGQETIDSNDSDLVNTEVEAIDEWSNSEYLSGLLHLTGDNIGLFVQYLEFRGRDEVWIGGYGTYDSNDKDSERGFESLL